MLSRMLSLSNSLKYYFLFQFLQTAVWKTDACKLHVPHLGSFVQMHVFYLRWYIYMYSFLVFVYVNQMVTNVEQNMTYYVYVKIFKQIKLRK